MMNIPPSAAPNPSSPQFQSWGPGKQFSGPMDAQMNVPPPTDNSGYNPLRELTTLDYPPAAEVSSLGLNGFVIGKIRTNSSCTHETTDEIHSLFCNLFYLFIFLMISSFCLGW